MITCEIAMDFLENACLLIVPISWPNSNSARIVVQCGIEANILVVNDQFLGVILSHVGWHYAIIQDE